MMILRCVKTDQQDKNVIIIKILSIGIYQFVGPSFVFSRLCRAPSFIS